MSEDLKESYPFFFECEDWGKKCGDYRSHATRFDPPIDF